MTERIKPSMSSGEISPSLWSRVDLERFQTSLRRCENMIVLPYGGVAGRPGFGYTQKTKYPDQVVVLVKFVYSREQAYAIEFGPNYALFMANDAMVVDATSVAISGVSLTMGLDYLVVTTLLAHALSVGDVVIITAALVDGALSLVNDRHTVAQIVSATEFWVAVNTVSATGAWSGGGVIQKCVQVVTPYGSDKLSELRFTQSVDVLSIFHEDFATREIRRTAVDAFEFAIPEYEDGPFLDVNVDEDISVYATEAIGNIEIVASAPIFNLNHVGALFKIKEKNIQKTTPWEPNKAFGSNPLGLLRRSDGKTYECVSSVTFNSAVAVATGTVAPTHDVGVVADGDGNQVSGLSNHAGVEWLYLHSGFGIARITGYLNQTTVRAEVLATLPDSVVGGATISAGPWTMIGDGVDVTLSIAGASGYRRDDYDVRIAGNLLAPNAYSVNGVKPRHFVTGVVPTVMTFATPPLNGLLVEVIQGNRNNLTDLWSFGAWSQDQGYPSVGVYHGDRFVAASTRAEPERFDMSRVGVYKDFSVSVPVQDDDAISFTVNSREVSDIRDLIALDQLVAMTGIAAIKIGTGTEDALTPGNTSVRTQSFRGSSYVAAQTVGDGAVFAQRNGTKLRDLSYQYEGAKFTGQELSLLVRHLFGSTRQIVDMAYADEPDNLLWVVVSSGALYSLTYIKEQEVVGWSRQPMTGFVERVLVIPDGTRDVLYAAIKRTVNGRVVRYIEKLTSSDYDNRVDAVCVDSSLTYDGRGTGGQTLTLGGSSDWTAGESALVTVGAVPGFRFGAADVGEQVLVYKDEYTYRGTIEAVVNDVSAIVRHAEDVDPRVIGAVSTTWAIARQQFGGILHLIGETVAVSADGEDAGTHLVGIDGSVTIEPHGAVVHVGLPYVPLIETLDIDQELLSSKKITELGLFVQDTTYVEVAGEDGVFTAMRTREDGDDYSTPNPTTGIVKLEVQSGFTQGGRITVRQPLPVPIKLLSIIPNIVRGST